MNRVKFFSKTDLSCGFNLIRAYEIVSDFDENKEDYTINDILEFCNIVLYVNNECYLEKWGEKEIGKLKDVSSKMKRKIGIFLNNINDSNIENVFEDIDKRNWYYEDFFREFETYKLYERITGNVFKRLLDKNNVLNCVLQNRKIVKTYGNEIREKILKESENIVILLNKYELEKEGKDIFLPEELISEDKEKLIIDYINSENPNINYLRVIENIQSNKDAIEISDKTKLMVKRKIKEQTDKHFKTNEGMKMETLVAFSEEKQELEVKIEGNGQNIECIYDLNWIKENQEYPTLLNNYIYLFFYVDMQMRISLVSKKSKLGIFERYIFIKSKNSYKKGMAFDRISLLSDMQMMGYYERLKDLGIRLENIIEWFFKNYLLEEFNINDFRISIPSENSTTLEKCRTILSEMDHIIKEYQLIIEDGKIDHELIEISSTPMLFKDIKSLVKNKYVYGASKEYELLEYYFFSDQCMLHYIERIKENYSSFYDLISNEKIKKEDYAKYADIELNYLMENNYIIEDVNGYLKIENERVLQIFKDLYENEVISYWKYSETYRKEIDKLVESNMLYIKSSLLSQPEIDYFNYYLNRAEFNNGLDLRNKYIHGTQPSGEEDEEKHRYNYMIFLKLFILLIIKINDDLCICNSRDYIETNEEKLKVDKEEL